MSDPPFNQIFPGFTLEPTNRRLAVVGNELRVHRIALKKANALLKECIHRIQKLEEKQ